ncbi:MAG: hypothetical protein KQJ78_04770 [Deltaproteobacteria bacterium]|nr:hypothetical protein [Deltaproteobacteria bacterium]
MSHEPTPPGEYAKILAQPRSLLELEKKDPRAAEALWHGLSRAERLRVVLAAPPLERERLLTLAQDSQELVRALAPDEFASTVLELGTHDAEMLVALSSDEQLNFLLDLTGWVREEFAPERFEAWLPLLLEAGSERVTRWLANTSPEVLALLLAHWVRVEKFLPSQDQQEPPDDLPDFTLDGVYFLEFRDPDTRDPVAQALVVLKSELPDLYRTVLEAMLWESGAGMAEDALRWRLGRLADLGFPGRMEALELWARPAPGEAAWEKLPPKDQLDFLVDEPPRSDVLLGLLPQEETLPALAGELDQAGLDVLKAELAYVANCGVVALDADPADPEAVRRAAAESLGLVNLGLSRLAQGDHDRARQILARLGLSALARQGAAAIRELNQRAWKLIREGWLKDIPTGLAVLDPPWDRWLAGLLFPRPRFFDPNLGEGRDYRAFRSLADLAEAARRLEQVEFWGELLFDLLAWDRTQVAAMLGGHTRSDPPQEIRLTHLVATWLARRGLGLPGLAPLAREQVVPAALCLQKGLGHGLDAELMTSLEALGDPGKAQLAGEALRGVLGRLREDFRALEPEKGLDPRYTPWLVMES